MILQAHKYIDFKSIQNANKRINELNYDLANKGQFIVDVISIKFN